MTKLEEGLEAKMSTFSQLSMTRPRDNICGVEEALRWLNKHDLFNGI